MRPTEEIILGDPINIATWKNKTNKEYDYDPNEFVLFPGEYVLEISYPLENAYTEMRKLTKPMTRNELINWIVDRYHKLYTEDARTSTLKKTYARTVGANTLKPKGKYGIWKHNIAELKLYSVYLYEDNYITLNIE